jgi:hypothetical protein
MVEIYNRAILIVFFESTMLFFYSVDLFFNGTDPVHTILGL